MVQKVKNCNNNSNLVMVSDRVHIISPSGIYVTSVRVSPKTSERGSYSFIVEVIDEDATFPNNIYAQDNLTIVIIP